MTTDGARALRAVVCVMGMLAAAAAYGQGGRFIKWESVNNGLDLGTGRGVVEVAAGGEQPVAYAVVDGVGLFRSEDLGAAWTRLQGEAPCLQAPYTVAVSPAEGNVVFASVATEGGGLWRSGDGGKTWAKCGDKATGMASDDVEWVTIPSFDPNLVLVGQRAGQAISVSKDGGRTWSTSTVGTEVMGQIPFGIAGGKWVLASRAPAQEGREGIWYTENSGADWFPAVGAGQATRYFTGPLPVIQTGESLFSSQHHGINRSLDGGKTWQYVMEEHTRVVGTAGKYAFRESRTAIRGTNDRLLVIQMSDNYGQSWTDLTGALCSLVPDNLRPNLIISNEVDPYAHVRIATAWCSCPDERTVFLALGKAGLYRGSLMWTAKGPIVAGVALKPDAVVAGDAQARVTVWGAASARVGAGVKRIFADLSALGQPDLELFDDGKHQDGPPGDKTYANTFSPPPGLSPGEKVIGVVAEDDSGNVSSAMARLTVGSVQDKLMIWDGEKFASGLSWVSPTTPLNFIKAQSEEAHNGNVALEFHGEGSGWIGGGWNWHGWWPADSGDDISDYRNLSFWMKVESPADKRPDGINLSLNCSSSRKATPGVNVLDYCEQLLDGAWHEVIIPLVDMYQGKTDFDAAKAWELDIDTWSPHDQVYSVFLDEIAFEQRPVRAHSAWVTLPEARPPKPVGQNPSSVTAEVDVKAEGSPISPYIYGAAMGDRKAAVEMGLTMLRAGGNPVSPVNWKHGYGAKGSDWFFQNTGEETPPARNWLVTFHGENNKAGLETYLTIPTMGRVAKDGTSVAFDIRKYPDQESWAGKSQPTDRLPNAGNGRQFVRGADGNILADNNGRPVLRDIESDPNETSVAMPPEEQAQMLEFMVKDLGYGTADKGGVKFIALDNEPTLWHRTHRGMHPEPCSYDELWERTSTYAGLLKKLDPNVKIAGPTSWGWTAYFYSGLDAEAAEQGKATWDDPPDFAAHGRIPITKWWLQKLREYEQNTGVRLVDILDFHFYPQTGIYMAGAPTDPKVMEGRVQETRVMWDPDWADPSWTANDPNGRKVGGRLKLIHLMKGWITECNPGMMTCLGEYSFGGDTDVSGGVAQCELLGVFAREGLDFAFFWFFPAVNSPQYFAFKMLRNPDGQHTAFGDRYLPCKCSAPDDISVHAARDTKTGKLTFVLVNKRAAKDARVTLNLSAPVPAQDVTLYEYSDVDRFTIGELPARKLSGRQIQVDLPRMTVLRFDLRT